MKNISVVDDIKFNDYFSTILSVSRSWFTSYKLHPSKEKNYDKSGFNYGVSLVYKPVENVSLYTTYNVKFYNIIIIIASTLLTATCVSFCGIVGWVGLIIPHIMRFVVGVNFITLFPASLLGGGLFLLIVDTSSRSLMASEIPLGVITSLVGAPLFVYLLYKSKKGFA